MSMTGKTRAISMAAMPRQSLPKPRRAWPNPAVNRAALRMILFIFASSRPISRGRRIWLVAKGRPGGQQPAVSRDVGQVIEARQEQSPCVIGTHHDHIHRPARLERRIRAYVWRYVAILNRRRQGDIREGGEFANIEIKIAAAVEVGRETAAHDVLETACTHALGLNLAGADHPRSVGNPVLDDIFAEQHETGLENHAEKIEERAADEGELDGGHTALRLSEPLQKSGSAPIPSPPHTRHSHTV